MKILLAPLLLAVSLPALALFVSPAIAGVPEAETTSRGKWQKVSPNWTIDTEDVELKRDKIRFWVKRTATGNEEMSTQSTARWTGKIRLRCNDFHYRIEIDSYNWGWERMQPGDFAYDLASYFCYLTETPGFTPEPMKYTWQKKITEEIEKQLSPEAISRIANRQKNLPIETDTSLPKSNQLKAVEEVFKYIPLSK